MRKIKFRAWDVNNKTWTFVTLGDLVCGACTIGGDKPLSGSSQTWEQYTGLKDKNGTEIYAGDICSFFTKNGKYVGVVERSDDLASFGLRMVKNNFSYTFSELNTMMVDLDTLEVAGNIHEQPELLKERSTE